MKAIRTKSSMRKRRAAFVENEVSRWNCKDHPIKQVTDGMESLRVFLKNADEMSLLEWARAVYLRYATREGIAADYAAISSNVTLLNFIEKYESIDDVPLDVETLKRVERDGLDWKGCQ